MKNTKTMRRLTAIVGTAIIAVSAMAATATMASEKELTPAATTITVQVAKAKSLTFIGCGETSYGYNWDYSANNDIAKVNVNYDFKTNKYTFNLTGKRAGTGTYKLVYFTSDKTTKSIAVTINVDAQGNVTRLA